MVDPDSSAEENKKHKDDFKKVNDESKKNSTPKLKKEDSFIEREEQYEHPVLPDWITLRPKVHRYREHPIKSAVESARDNQVNEKVLRCNSFKENRMESCPVSFRENTNKEKLILEHVKKYGEQFSIAYKDNRPLFLYPKNECDIEKFVSTTIRPTKMGYLEFYDYSKCAEYVSNFIIYEPLEDPLSFPEHMPSPASIIEW